MIGKLKQHEEEIKAPPDPDRIIKVGVVLILVLIVLFYYACLFGAYYILAGRQQTLATAGARGGASRDVKTFGSARRTMAATVTRASGTAVLGSTDASKTTLLPTDLNKTPTLSSGSS